MTVRKMEFKVLLKTDNELSVMRHEKKKRGMKNIQEVAKRAIKEYVNDVQGDEIYKILLNKTYTPEDKLKSKKNVTSLPVHLSKTEFENLVNKINEKMKIAGCNLKINLNNDKKIDQRNNHKSVNSGIKVISKLLLHVVHLLKLKMESENFESHESEKSNYLEKFIDGANSKHNLTKESGFKDFESVLRHILSNAIDQKITGLSQMDIAKSLNISGDQAKDIKTFLNPASKWRKKSPYDCFHPKQFSEPSLITSLSKVMWDMGYTID